MAVPYISLRVYIREAFIRVMKSIGKKKKRRKRRRGKKWANDREESEKDEWGRGKQILLPGIRNRSGSIYEPFNREIVI